MGCKTIIALCLCLLTSAVKANSGPALVLSRSSTSTVRDLDLMVYGQISSSIFFQDMALEYFSHAGTCKQINYVPARTRIIRMANAMWRACEAIKPFGTWIYPNTQLGPEWRPYYLFTLMMTESNGKSHNTAKPGEKSYGPWCVTPTEARAVCYNLGIPCPRYTWDIADKLQDDLNWSALMALGAWEFYAEQSRGDVMVGLMKYKYGAAKLGELLTQNKGDVKRCFEYKKFSKKLDTVRCVITKIGYQDPCFCFNGDQ